MKNINITSLFQNLLKNSQKKKTVNIGQITRTNKFFKMNEAFVDENEMKMSCNVEEKHQRYNLRIYSYLRI